MDSFRVEYLIPIKQDSVFCNTIMSFKKILESIGNLVISSKTINFNKVEFNYELQQTNPSEHHSTIYFHLKITLNDIKYIDIFEELLRNIRTVFSKIGEQRDIPVLWNDMGLFYAKQAYEEIYLIENLMRKLITKFMLINIGDSWKDDNVPKEVNDSIRKDKSESSVNSYNYLFEIDFIQISKFLFNKYTPIKPDDYFSNINDVSQINPEKLSILIPKSNWEKYFNQVVQYDYNILKKRWESLYAIRNKVAHNKGLPKNELNSLNDIIKEIRPVIETAINNLDSVIISDSDRESITENSIVNINELLGIFLREYKNLQENTEKIVVKYLSNIDDLRSTRRNINSIFRIYSEKIIDIPSKINHSLRHIHNYRNKIMHDPRVDISEQEINHMIELIHICNSFFIELLEQSPPASGDDSSQNETE